MWRVRGFCLQGYGHLKEGTPCQDSYQHVSVRSPGGQTVEVLAVADGAGSRRRSAEGAALAVTLATEILGAAVQEDGLPGDWRLGRAFLLAAYGQIRSEFARLTGLWVGPGDIGLFATTLTAAVLADGCLGVVQAGDGFAIVRAGEVPAGPDGGRVRQYHLLPRDETGSEYANEARFLTSATAGRPQISVVRDAGITGVLLSTDGLAQPALTWAGREPDGVNASFAEAILDHLDDPGHDPRRVVRTMMTEDIVQRTSDDLTLLAAVRA
jgi:Protein phosphatase 2C